MYHMESIEFRETQCDEIPVGRVEKLTQITGDGGLHTDMDLCALVTLNFISPTSFESQKDAWEEAAAKWRELARLHQFLSDFSITKSCSTWEANKLASLGHWGLEA